MNHIHLKNHIKDFKVKTVLLLLLFLVYNNLECLCQNQSLNELINSAYAGNDVAQFNLGFKYYNGEGVAKDYVQAIYWYKKAAEQNNAYAQSNLGLMYYNGEGTTKDYVQAFYWYKKAAERNNAYAQNNLGLMYYNGEGTTKNYVQAIYWYKKAAEQNNATAQINLGLMYYNGEGTAKDYVQAFYWLKKAAEQNNAYAQINLGIMYYNGEGTTKDYVQAIYWYKKAAEQNNIDAQRSLGYLYFVGEGVSQDYSQSFYWYKKAAEQNDIQSQGALGQMYFTGVGITQDYDQAIFWYGKKAQQGDWSGMNALAYCYAGKKDYNKAHEWIKIAMSKFNEYSSEYAFLLDSDGEIYLMEGKTAEAGLIWNQMKSKHTEYIEENKYKLDNVFTRTMYEREQSVTPLLAKKDNSKVIVSDIDQQIPENSITGKPVFAVIIANENYNEVENVPFAIRDGESFKSYCEITLGIPEKNIKIVPDATLNNMKRQINWINQVMDVYEGEATIIFYYAGHGIPDESNKSAYLLPVDGIGNDATTGYSIDQLYEVLGNKPAKSIWVIFDACFSGTKRDGGMLASARGVAIKAKTGVPKGNMVVLSAAQEDQTAYPLNEQGHGMFTYYLLKKLKETEGNATLGELSDYVIDQVKKQSVVINGKLQTPTVLVSPIVSSEWKNWKLR